MTTQTLTLEITEAKPGKIGAEIRGLDVNSLTSESPELELIRHLIYKNKLVVLRDQEVNAEEYVAFTRKLARPQVYFQPQYHHPNHA
ncbi:MAG: TauD/TfdA family dioxygenase, partial [Methylococcaceae bacterium]|nr:TauD/TfdA family dioxygenase [Methylococcaceae bacterium]